jgi:hypothetical protein
MRVDMEDRDPFIHRPLARAPDGFGAHHRADTGILQVLVVAHRPVFPGENEQLIVRRRQPCGNKPDALMRERMRTPQVDADGGDA